jgi:hypothetical protein
VGAGVRLAAPTCRAVAEQAERGRTTVHAAPCMWLGSGCMIQAAPWARLDFHDTSQSPTLCLALPAAQALVGAVGGNSEPTRLPLLPLGGRRILPPGVEGMPLSSEGLVLMQVWVLYIGTNVLHGAMTHANPASAWCGQPATDTCTHGCTQGAFPNWPSIWTLDSAFNSSRLGWEGGPY